MDELDSPQRQVSASRWLRLANFFIDYIGQLACVFTVAFTLGVAFGPKGAQLLTQLHPLVLGVLTMLIYYTALEGLFGRTLGKLVTGTCVVNDKGECPTFGQILGRSCSRLIPFEPISILLNDDGRGWHDSIPETYVVRRK